VTIDWNPTFVYLIRQLWGGIPHSFSVDDGYWFSPAYLNYSQHAQPIDGMVAIQDRTCTKFGLNLYDGAVWELALMVDGEFELQESYERQVLYCSTTGRDNIGLKDIRADTPDFRYGVNGVSGEALDKVLLPGNCSSPNDDNSNTMPGAFMFRMVSNTYTLTDPILGNYAESFKFNASNSTSPRGPTWNKHGQILWNDWKPIMGENVWSLILAPLQLLYMQNNNSIPSFTTVKDAPDRVKLALSVMPAMKAMVSPSGSIYHCPNGSQLYPYDPEEETNVSNENNFSATAALRMLQFALKNGTNGQGDAELQQHIKDVDDMLDGLMRYWKANALSDVLASGNRVFFQGGHAPFKGGFNPVPLTDSQGFAVDCQTWGVTVLGGAYIDQTFGDGTAYHIWVETKTRARYHDAAGTLRGVGYTDHPDHDIWSSEWSFGAVLMTRELADFYKTSHPAWANELLADSQLMEAGLGWSLDTGGLLTKEGAYVYCNKQIFIPWGWWGHSVPSTAGSGWARMNAHKFNPFILGGGLTPCPY